MPKKRQPGALETLSAPGIRNRVAGYSGQLEKTGQPHCAYRGAEGPDTTHKKGISLGIRCLNNALKSSYLMTLQIYDSLANLQISSSIIKEATFAGGFREQGSNRRTNGKHQLREPVMTHFNANSAANEPLQILFYRFGHACKRGHEYV